MNRLARSGERVLLAAGTKTYEHGAEFRKKLEDLDRVPEALRWVVDTLTDLGYTSQVARPPGYLLDPNLQQLKDAVRAAAGSAPVVVLYYTGHGLVPDRGTYYLVTARARPGQELDDNVLEASHLLRLVLRFDASNKVASDEEQPQVLLILDCCFSGAGGIEVLNKSLQGVGNPNVWVLASASSLEYAQQGRFAEALKQTLRNPAAGNSQEFLGLESIVGKINATLRNAEQRARYFPPGGESTGLPLPFFPNPEYEPDVAGLTVAEQQHWVSRLRGAPTDSISAGFYVTGRVGRIRVVENLARWMRDPDRHGLAVVTGSPGSGKSAMLALPVLLTDADGQRRDALVVRADPGSLIAQAADLFDGLRVLAVHARGVNPYEVTNAIAGSLGRSAATPEKLLEDLETRPEMSSQILVVDAVDEAHDPRRLLTDLLLPLARRPGMRIVIGARRHILPPPADTSLWVDLDSEDYRDREALADYAHQLLIAAHEPSVPTPYRDRDEIAATVAAAIAEKATARPTATGRAESFLLAQLLARTVRGRQQILDVTRAGWTEQLPADVGAAFDEDLLRLGAREPTARALLAALAWAKGPGLPWETIWVPVARELAAATGTGTPLLDDEDVRWLRDNAGAYYVEELGPGQRSVFRPFHDLLAAHLRGQPSDEQSAADRAVREAWEQRRQQAEGVITRTLISGVLTASDGRADWELAHPYLRTYLAQHAHAAGPNTFAEFVADLDYLAVADPTTLPPLLTPTDPALRSVARSYRRAHPLLGGSARDNSAYLQEAFIAETGSHPTGQRIRPTYRTLMARVLHDDSLLTLTAHRGTVRAVAFGVDADARRLLATASDDKTVRLWDPATGTPIGQPLTGHTGGVSALAFGVGADGRPLLATASHDKTVRLWDLTTGTPIGQPLTGHTGGVSALAFGVDADGRPLMATASSDDHTVRLWDPATGTRVGDPLDGHLTLVEALAFGVDGDGRPLLASAGYDVHDGSVRLWDPTTGTLIRRSRVRGGVWALAFGIAADGRPLMATAGGDDRDDHGTVRLWDPATGTPIGQPLTGHTGGVSALAFGVDSDGRPLLASAGSDDGTVRLWDPTTGTPIGQPLTGHTGGVRALAFGVDADGRPLPLLATAGSYDETVRLWAAGPAPSGSPPMTRLQGGLSALAFGVDGDGRPLLASAGSDDGTVRLWDPTTGTPIGQPLTGHSRVTALAFGVDADGRPLLAAAGSYDGKFWLWDPTAGTLICGPLLAHGDWLATVAFGVDAEGRRLLATAGYDGTVRLWDPTTGTPIGQPLTGHTGGVSALAFGVGADGRPLLATASHDKTVRLWDPTTGTPVGRPLTGHSALVAFGVDAEGRRLLATAGYDGTVRLWDPTTGTPIGQPLTGQNSRVMALTFGVGRPLLATAGDDRTVRLWDPTTGATVVRLLRRTHPRRIAAQGTRLAIADGEGMTVLEVIAGASY